MIPHIEPVSMEFEKNPQRKGRSGIKAVARRRVRARLGANKGARLAKAARRGYDHEQTANMSSLMRTILAAVPAAFCFVSISNAQQGLNYETNYLVSTFAGDGTIAYRDGTGTNAAFYGAAFITSDAANNSYFLDVGYTVIRKISPEAVVTTLAGRIGRTGTND